MGENTPTVIKHVVGKRARQYHKLPQALGLPSRTTPARFSETLAWAPGTATGSHKGQDVLECKEAWHVAGLCLTANQMGSFGNQKGRKTSNLNRACDAGSVW